MRAAICIIAAAMLAACGEAADTSRARAQEDRMPVASGLAYEKADLLIHIFNDTCPYYEHVSRNPEAKRAVIVRKDYVEKGCWDEFDGVVYVKGDLRTHTIRKSEFKQGWWCPSMHRPCTDDEAYWERRFASRRL